MFALKDSKIHIHLILGIDPAFQRDDGNNL